jgi:endoglucanase
VWQKHEQRDAAFVYVRTRQPGVNEEVRRNARNAILREADASVEMCQNTGFKWTRLALWAPFVCGTASTPGATTILRAHVLAGDEKYRRAAVLACQSGAGANPVNICYTTGLGHFWPQHPLMVDQRVMGWPPPPGITVYGPFDMRRDPNQFALKLMAPVLYPAAKEWPEMEAYFDIYLFPIVTEFTVMQNLGPNAYAWACLAARK